MDKLPLVEKVIVIDELPEHKEKGNHLVRSAPDG